MAIPKAKKSTTTTTEVARIVRLKTAETKINIVGTAPLLMERFSTKARQQLLQPSAQMNRAEKAQKLKHNPLEEFQQACYVNRDQKQPTMFHLPNGMIHGATASIAVDIPGAAKAQIERLTRIVDLQVNLYGIPSLHMAMVRSSGMNRTPDVRTRPAFEKWAASFTMRYATPVLTTENIADLIVSAGEFIGIGGWRPQKGGPYGTFRVALDSDSEFKAIIKNGGRAQQLAAYRDPAMFDEDTAELFAWYQEEVKRREFITTINGDAEPYEGDDDEGLEAAA